MELHSSHVLTDRIARSVPCTTSSLSMSAERVANIDRLRIVAAMGIVWFHMEGVPHREIGYAGLPVFLLIFFSLITSRGRSDGTIHFLKRRWDRLMVPWLFWSVVYGLCKLGKAVCVLDMNSVRSMLSMESLLAGTHIHLWYLPYAFIAGLLIRAVNGWTSGVSNTAAVHMATILGVLMLVGHAMGMLGNDLMTPLPQWGYGLAAIPLGFAIGRCRMVSSRETQRLLLLMVALTVLAMCTILNSVGYTSLAIPYGLATSLVCMAYVWPSRSDAFVAYVAPLTFGIYLLHPLVMYGLRHSIVTSQHPAAFMIMLSVCISGLAAFGLMKTPLRRFV